MARRLRWHGGLASKRSRTSRPLPPPTTVYESTPGAATRPLPSGYRRREPDKTLLYRVVSSELAPLVADVEQASPYGRGLPGHVLRELERYLACGLLSGGFCRVVCRRCRAEHLVATSCKGRAVCPSCGTRRMHDTAAHLVSRVLPHIAMRQWVVTFAPRVRWHLAADPKLASAAITVVLRTLFRFQRRRARAQSLRLARNHSTGAVTFVQRFDSALRLNFHLHALLCDGVFVQPDPDPDARPRFVPLAPPTDDQVHALLDEIIEKVTALLRRRGRLDDDAAGDPDPDDVMGDLRRRAARSLGSPSPGTGQELPPRCARKEGWSLHAAVAIHENDRAGLERLCAYGLRPALSPERLSQGDDGILLYRMKRRFSDGTQTLKCTPRELLIRLCALVAPPRFHMVRYHGIFAAHARGRYALTGRGLHHSPAAVAPTAAAPPPSITPRSLPTPAAPPSVHGPDAAELSRRLSWADLMARVWKRDVLSCPRCGGRMRVVAFLSDLEVVRRVLDHLGLPSNPPPRGPPRPAPLPQFVARPPPQTDGVDPPAAD